MEIPKKTIIIFSIVALAIFIAGWIVGKIYKNNKEQKEIEQNMMYHVHTGDLKVEVKVTATANLMNEQKLSFWQEWKITSVKIWIWNEIKAWDILAELSMNDYQNAIQASKLELENAKLWLSKLLNNDTSLAEAKIQSQINETKNSYEIELEQYKILWLQLETTIKQKENQLEQAFSNYQLAKNSIDISWPSSLEDREQKVNIIINQFYSKLWNAELIIESIDKIFWISDTFSSQASDYANTISNRKTILKRQTSTNITQSYAFIKNFKNKTATLNTTSSDKEIYDLVKDFYNEAEILINLCDTALSALDMTTSNSSLTQTMLTSFSTTINTARTTSISLRNELDILANSINPTLSSYETQQSALQKQKDDINLLANEIKNLEKDYDNQLNRKQSQIKSLNENISIFQKELIDIKDWADAYDIQQQRNRVSQAQLKLERTIDQQDDYQIIAEFDGRVRTVDIKEGEQYKLDDRNFIIIENPNLIELELQVSQIDIVKIKKWNPVIITFDAYPNTPIQAVISTRNVNPISNNRWWIYYKATIVLEKQKLEILAGMTALVTVTTDEVKNTTLIPTLALIQKDEKEFVLIQKDWKYLLHEITLGISNNFQAEIIDWLNVWDTIKSSVLDEETLIEMWIDDTNNPIF